MKPRTKTDIAKRLSKNKKVDFDAILEYITNYCVQSVKKSGDLVSIDDKPNSMELKYLLYPLLVDMQPTTIYCKGGMGKSTLADYIALLVSRGMADNPTGFIPNRARPVLYLDWEGEAETHRRYITAIKKGLRINGNIPIHYKKMEHPLSQVIDSVRHTVKDKSIGLVIIDSQMAATASGTRGLTEAQVASEFYNNIRSLECTSLTLDHITKQGMTENGVEAPFGSIVKYNRSRSQFELRLDDSMDESDHKEYVLVHRKFNLGRKQKPIGFSMDFTNNDLILEEIQFATCKVNDSIAHPKEATARDKIINALLDGPVERNELCKRTGVKQGTLRQILLRAKDTEEFYEEDGKIGYSPKY
jgi:hypothetical protein